MKKLIVLTLCAFCASLARAESMQFVTLLSQPVGSFAKVKLLEEANIGRLNFCQASLDGTIDASEVKVDTLNVNNTLGGNAGTYTLGVGGSIKLSAPAGTEALTGKFLNTEKTMPANAKLTPLKISGKEVNIKNNVTSQVASFNTMTLTDKAVLASSARPLVGTKAKGTMEWKKYKKDGCSGENCPFLLMGEPTNIFSVNQGWVVRNPGTFVDGVFNPRVVVTPTKSVVP